MKKEDFFPTLSVSDKTPEQTIILGTNGTGKTTYLEKMVISELTQIDRRILVIVPDALEWNTLEYIDSSSIYSYVGVRKIIYFSGLIEILRLRFKNGLLIFEDCRAYFPLRINDQLQGLIIRRRQNNVDIVAVGHGFSEIPKKFFTFSTNTVLFKTIDNIVKRKNVIGNYEELKAAQIRVNAQTITNPHYFEKISIKN
jgi:Cdc6-like AAA superfamily ATPase